jgi:heptaprenyl diphosphate synthase
MMKILRGERRRKFRTAQPGKLPARKVLALLGAFCLFLSTVEYMIPKPLPFIRLGIANLPLLLALDILPFSSFLLLICVKSLGQAVITGTLFSYVFLFSLGGTAVSALSMYGVRKYLGKERISLIGTGTIGAFLSNVTQLGLAGIFVLGQSMIYIIPPFLAAGTITGFALGLFCELFTRRSVWYARRLEEIRGTRDRGGP